MTDAYVAMGLLRPELFLGGEMALDRDAAIAALDTVAAPLQMDPIELAQGAFAIANTTIGAAVAAMTTHRGLDPREFSLLAYGAAGPVQAVGVARELGIGEVVVPYFPGGFSAFGMIASRSRVEYSRSVMTTLDSLDAGQLNAVLAELADACREDLVSQGVAADDVTLDASYYAMYSGQGQDNRLPLPGVTLSDADLDDVAAAFHRFYDRRFGYQAPEIPIFVSSLSVVAFGPAPKVVLPAGDAAGGADDALIVRGELHIDGQSFADAGFYDRPRLREGDELAGPAIIDDRLGTIVVNPGATARVARHGTLRIEV
jgi:N-methylhydantoinase A